MSTILHSDTTRIALSVLGMTLISMVAAAHWEHSSFWLITLTLLTTTGSGLFWMIREHSRISSEGDC